MKTALITGASGGIGKELAYIHAEKKGDLILVARNEPALKNIQSDLENKYGIQVLIIAKDLSIPDGAVRFLKKLPIRILKWNI